MKENKETACLQKLSRGHDAWEEFWELFGGLIEAEVRRFDRVDSQYVDDVFQDLVLKLLKHDCREIRNYLATPKRTSFRAFIRKAVRNLLVDEYRKSKRRGEFALHDGDIGVLASLRPSASDQMDVDIARRLAVSRVLRVVCGGGEDTNGSRILHLRFIEGVSVNIIGEQLGMKPNTVSQRIKYYLQKIRKHHMEEIRAISNE